MEALQADTGFACDLKWPASRIYSI